MGSGTSLGALCGVLAPPSSIAANGHSEPSYTGCHTCDRISLPTDQLVHAVARTNSGPVTFPTGLAGVVLGTFTDVGPSFWPTHPPRA